MPRWVFALLRGPLLASNTPLSCHAMSDDQRTWLLTLYSCLSVDELLVGVQPELTAYRTADEVHTPSMPLSWRAMAASECPIFVLDAFTVIFVYLAADWRETSGDTEFPPSKQSKLWLQVTRLKQGRMHTPRIVSCAGATAAAEDFDAYICEDEADETQRAKTSTSNNVWAGPDRPAFTFQKFMEYTAREALEADGSG